MTLNDDRNRAASEVLGYLNFSSGATDPKVLRNLILLFSSLESQADCGACAWQALGTLLQTQLRELQGTTPAFSDVQQAQIVLSLVFENLLPEYRSFHRDLLFHQEDAALFRPLFIGRCMEAVLQQGGPWDETDRIVQGGIARLNDYVGHRPVAVLNTPAKLEPYPHERVRPVPLYVAGAGYDGGEYGPVLELALRLLQSTDPAILRAAHFDPAVCEEIAFDPRAYDFDHPVNRRPNYHFGQWDPHVIDGQGRYRRFVLQQVTLDAIVSRLHTQAGVPHAELQLEAAAVLAGVMLMASAMSGEGPEAHDSSVSLANLLPRIARFRDEFYEGLMSRIDGEHGIRLQEEAQRLRQPFGGARQHLNYGLARRRAEQLQHVHLAQLYARMGYPDAARRQANLVPVSSARMRSEIMLRLTAAHHCLDRDQLEQAAALRPEIVDFLHRGIECGALVDPWNILGFQANFSIFSALENTVHDYRVDELIELMHRIFALDARLQCRAAISGRGDLREMISAAQKELAGWWDQFATTEVSGVEHVHGYDSWESTTYVTDALAAAHDAGPNSANLGFWKQQLAGFRSPKAYALVVQALVERHDQVAAMALLIQWLSDHESIPLEQGDYSFHELTLRWINDVLTPPEQPTEEGNEQAWSLVRRFFDYAEANAEGYWGVPQLDRGPVKQAESSEQDDEEDDLFQAAYEGVTYKDSTGDGIEGSLIESGPQSTELEFEEQARRITQQLAFLYTIARLWKTVAMTPRLLCGESAATRHDTVATWLESAKQIQLGLKNLLRAIDAESIPAPSGSRESLLEYDRRRMAQHALLERVIATIVVTADAVRYLGATLGERAAGQRSNWEETATCLFAGVIRGDTEKVRRELERLTEQLRPLPLLYRPLAAGGDANQIVESQELQHLLGDLVTSLPRLGLLSETCDLVVLAQTMELSNPIGRAAVSEFDRLFRLAFGALVESIVAASARWNDNQQGEEADTRLIECLEPLTEKLLNRWLLHSRSLRLSVLEKAMDDKEWNALVDFTRKYGGDLFTQSFFHMGNLRAILHQGVVHWLTRLQQNADESQHFQLLDDLDVSLPKADAAAKLEIVFEAILEHYPEYKDYNNIATQSDRGDMLYVLLDFLRLKVRYERVVWNLRPVFYAHDVLVRANRLRAAGLWQKTFRAKTKKAADWHDRRLQELVEKYGLKLPSVADRLAERFVRPLTLDRIRALVRPAVAEAREDRKRKSFGILEQEVTRFAREPTGAGLDVPAWLVTLERELDEAERQRMRGPEPRTNLPQAALDFEDVLGQLEAWEPIEENRPRE